VINPVQFTIEFSRPEGPDASVRTGINNLHTQYIDAIRSGDAAAVAATFTAAAMQAYNGERNWRDKHTKIALLCGREASK
jgi:hypothetical protein